MLSRLLLNCPKLLGKCTRRCDCDHIHLRCPGNMGLIGCFIQMLFPSKTKTAKYAGNWVPNNLGPISYSHGFWVIAFDAQYDCIGLRGLEQSNNKYQIFFYSYLFAKWDCSDELQIENSSFQFIFVGALVKVKSVVCH
jgi:hypothetical protein